jgi:protoporphyrinogen oxidase
MKIAIIGAGFAGLAAAYDLSSRGHSVVIFERDPLPGGLAVGYREKNWEWTLEKHYHHWFTNDTAVLELAKKINHKVYIKRPHTNWFIHNRIYEFDSIPAALKFPALPLPDRLRNLATLGFLRFFPFWKFLEQFNAQTILPRMMGKKAYSLLWEPLFSNKFGAFADDISLAWFWARIKKRTQSLAYPEGGFLRFAEHLVAEIEKQKGTVLFSTAIEKLEDNDQVSVTYTNSDEKSQTENFDQCIVTLPSFLFLAITPDLPEEYKNRLIKLKGIGATNLVLRLKKPFFADNTYWLSVADKKSPIMAIVEHTNFMDKKRYDNEHLVYLGNYLAPTDPQFKMEKEELLALYDPYLQQINPEYKKSIIGYELFRAPFAQPIIPKYYSKHIPPMTTPLPHVYLANIEQVYPWDRGTNYAVELGQKVAKLISNS